MTLRSRLTVAFFAIAVIPLSAVTLFSYWSSERALKRAAEQQAASMAAELGRRMEWVTTDLERRMDRLWPMPDEQRMALEMRQGQPQQRSQPPSPAPGRRPAPPATAAPATPAAPAAPDVAGHLAQVLGDAAPMIESLEIIPGRGGWPGWAPPPPPGGTSGGAVTPPAPPSAPASGPGPADGARRVPPEARQRAAGVGEAAKATGMVSVEMSRVIDKAMEAYKAGGGSGFDVTAWSRAMQQRIGQAGAAATQQDVRRLTEEARALEREAARLRAAAGQVRAQGPGQTQGGRSAAAGPPAASGTPTGGSPARPAPKATTKLRGADVDSTVQSDGQEVGRIHARLNMPRLFRAILPPDRRDEGELVFAIDEKGEIQAREADKGAVAALQKSGAIPADGASVRQRDWVVVTKKGPGGMTFGTARPVGNELRELRNVAARNFAVGFGLIVVVFFASVPLASGMTRNLRTLMQGVHAVAQGNLSTRVPVKSNDEFGKLAAAFNQMAADLAQHEKLVVQQERLKRELELSRQIQNDMLPREPLRLGFAEVKGVSIPAREVGGDFFNYFVLPSGEIAVLVGDASGKGVGAALLMANVQATLRARLPLEQDLARLAGDLDRDLYDNTPPEVYLTMFVGIVNPRTRVMRYVNAGHNTQFILRRAGGIDAMPSTGRPLALLPGGPYEERSTDLPEGDVLFFYTDGILDLENEAGEVFGQERLEAILVELDHRSAGVDNVLAGVEDALREFRGNAEQPDDATMMALRLSENV
jgi:serine phosphatase RsbU (regulator of sigma subunit)